MIVLYVFAFLSGLITILAPCIWPILPIVFSASTHAGRRRPIGITLGLLLSFTGATLLLSYAVRSFNIDPDILRWAAVVTIIVLGIVLLVPRLSAVLEGLVSRLQSRMAAKKPANPNQPSDGFWSGLLTGIALGFVWTPCAGPILATIVTIASTQALSIQVVLLTLAYSTGVAIPLFVLVLAGQKLFKRVRVFNKYTGRIQQIFGVVMIATAILIGTGYDRTLQTKLLDAFPGYGAFVVDLESTPVIQDQLDRIIGNNNDNVEAVKGSVLNVKGYPAPDLVGITNWLNSQPLTLDELKGKVVLIDIWTYTCINCIRTLPHVQGWYEKYKDDGFVVIGVHSPEFAFEKDPENVQAAIDEYGLTYPVAQDNDFATWQNYNNRYWPAEYLIDSEGNIRRTHFGEGEYEKTEQAIQELLREKGANVSDDTLNLPDETPQYVTTPETYLGLGRIDRVASPEPLQNGIGDYTFPSELALHEIAFNGAWDLQSQYAEANAGAQLQLHYKAADVFLVIEPASTGNTITVDGEQITLDGSRLYTLASYDTVTENTLTITFNDPGIQVFAFTFGG